jgi:hypothetical protein
MYGAINAQKSFRDYGFIPDGESEEPDCLTMTLMLSKQDPMYNLKHHILQRAGQTNFKLYLDYSKNSSALSVLRFLVFNEGEDALLEYITQHQKEGLFTKFVGEFTKPLSFANEKEVHEFLFCILKQRLNKYPDTI